MHNLPSCKHLSALLLLRSLCRHTSAQHRQAYKLLIVMVSTHRKRMFIL